MNDVLNCIKTRRSVKSYKPDMPKREDINTVIEAGIAAASGRNMQAPIVVAIANKALRDELSAANAAVMGMNADPFYGAPVVLVVLSRKSAHTYIYDGSLVLGNMMLAASSLGLGSCWVHRAKEVFDTPRWREFLISLGITEEVEGIGNLILGYADTTLPADKPRAPGRVYYAD